jgi:hypothetical protein
MTFTLLRRILCLAILLISLVVVPVVQAARGVPGSPEFGIGTTLDITSADLPTALQLLADLSPDWLRIEVRWDIYEPEPGFQADWGTLDQAMQQAANLGTPVAISMTAAPAWSMTGSGPQPEAAARFVLTLVGRYPGVLQAVELFPSANTLAGWQAQPDPASYGNLLQSVQSSLTGIGSPVWIVAGGLDPCSPDADALEFLRGLYASSGQPYLKIISLQFRHIVGVPIDPPGACVNLRYYELVREVMTANNHYDGKIWITHLNAPGGASPQEQQVWLDSAYTQIRSQLYFGSAFLQSVNATGSGALPLLQPDGGLHPFNSTLKSLIDQNRSLSQPMKPGRAKSAVFTKIRP